MTFRVFLWMVVLGLAAPVAQTVEGEITGRLHDRQGAPLPGVRITITGNGQATRAVTDADGGFATGSLAMGSYRVIAELPGYISAAGEISLSPSVPRAHLAWPLEPGCLEEEIRVILSARDAAPLAAAIVHLRVTSVERPVLMSVHPDCAARVLRESSVQVLGSASAHGRTSAGERQILVSRREAGLETGREYLALLRADGHVMEGLAFPIVSGRIASPNAAGLNGMRVDEALKILGQWSQERR